MAKTIKFNLICDEKPVRTIEDLKSNFSVEDVLAYYNNQLLHRWLQVRGYDKELNAVSAITSEDSMVIIKELIRIFDVTTDEKRIEESIYMLKYLDERKERSISYEQANYKAECIIGDYQRVYQQLVDGILENPYEIALIKANIAEIVSNYAWVFKLNHRGLFWTLAEKSALAVMCLLMNDKSREYYLPIKLFHEDGRFTLDIDDNPDKKAMYMRICELIRTSQFRKWMGGNLSDYSGETDGYWKDLEPSGNRYMIISMGSGDYVRSAGQTGGDLSFNDIQNQFVIVNGIDYKSNSSSRVLLYMEV